MKAFYCVGTHWDREWYEPFQEFRMWLVELIDEVLDLVERDPEYRCFHLDGQTIVLEDYLEIRPEQRERLLTQIRAGRILVGPWYNLPDEWLISGESFVRNLMKGSRICRDLGVPAMRYAYTPDQFGHIAALPMIMAGFGLPVGICWRGTQDEHYPAQFVWVGPDGSRMVTHKLKDHYGYDPFRMHVRVPLEKTGPTEAALQEHFDPYFEVEKNRAEVPLVLLLDAVDHQRPDPKMPALLRQLQARSPDVEFVWGTLEEYGREMLQYADQLPERSGELRQPSRAAERVAQYLIVHTISSRYPIKKRNGECQALLEKRAEPFALFQMMCGGAPVLSYLDRAWTYLLRNHPHDSICGCSIDQVHRDMRYRFDQAELIGDGVVRRAAGAVAAASAEPDAWKNLVVHNTLPFARKGVFDLAIPFPTEYGTQEGCSYIDALATSERINKFKLCGADGTPAAFQLRRIERGTNLRLIDASGRKRHRSADLYHVAVEMDLPPCGYTGLRVEPTTDAVRDFGTLRTGPLSASNGLIAVELDHDGTVSLRHAASGLEFKRLFAYEDCGDSGDGWTRGPLVDDIAYSGPGQVVATGMDEDGPLRTVFRVEREFHLPRRMDKPNCTRSTDRVAMRVTDLITVERHSPCLRVQTRIENTVQDHRFRVLFPTGIVTDRSFAETPFAVVEREIAVPAESAGWHERVNPETAFTNFCGVQDARGGLAVLSTWGLHEYEVTQMPERTLALTLFRATRQTVMTPGEPDGELLEEMTFDYQLYPFAGRFDAATALRLAGAQQAGVYQHHADVAPEPRSFLNVAPGRAVVTAIKPAHDARAGVIRFWNPEAEPVEERVSLLMGLEKAFLCTLNEETQKQLSVNPDGSVSVHVPAHGLATVLFTWKENSAR